MGLRGCGFSEGVAEVEEDGVTGPDGGLAENETIFDCEAVDVLNRVSNDDMVAEVT